MLIEALRDAVDRLARDGADVSLADVLVTNLEGGKDTSDAFVLARCAAVISNLSLWRPGPALDTMAAMCSTAMGFGGPSIHDARLDEMHQLEFGCSLAEARPNEELIVGVAMGLDDPSPRDVRAPRRHDQRGESLPSEEAEREAERQAERFFKLRAPKPMQRDPVVDAFFRRDRRVKPPAADDATINRFFRKPRSEAK